MHRMREPKLAVGARWTARGGMCHRPEVQRILVAASVVVAAAALVVAVVALREARQRQMLGGAGRASVSQLHGLMTQDDVRTLLGQPQTIFRDNARAQCWAYSAPYEVRICFGPKRRLAWWSASGMPLHPLG